MWFSVTLFTLLAISSFKDAVSDEVHTNTRYIVAKPGESILFICSININKPLEYCRMEIEGFNEARVLGPNKNKPGDRAQYPAGLSFERGQCGLNLTNIEERNNGPIKCTLNGGDTVESSQTMTLVVARTPSPPELKHLSGIPSSELFKEGDIIRLGCIVSKGRPAANLTWKIGEESIYDGLSSISTMREDNDLYTVSQNLTRTLQASDNGKEIKCIANHVALSPPNNQRTTRLRVNYRPKPWEKPYEQLGLVEGQEGKVVVVIQAFPKPNISWNIGREQIHEGRTDEANKYEVSRTVNKSGDLWETTLKINNLSQDDIQKTYFVKAINSLGNESYEVSISTSTEPRSSVSLGTIFFLFVALVIVAVIALAIFARARGLWCFAGVSRKVKGRPLESSDTESMNKPQPHEKTKKDKKEPKIGNVKAIFKKSKEVKPIVSSKSKSNAEDVESGTKKSQKKANDNVVYAELTLAHSSLPVARTKVNETEYAEIIHS